MSIRGLGRIAPRCAALPTCLVLIGGIVAAAGAQDVDVRPKPGAEPAGSPTRYLALQIFTGGPDSNELRKSFPPPPANLRETVAGMRARIGVAPAGGRRLGFVLGPIAFDNTDEQVRRLIADGFDIALETGVAVGFHIDDSMFWGRLEELNAPENLEWVDWQGTPCTGRRLDWSSKPLKIMPQLCFNSPGVRKAVSARATLIGREVAAGVERLRAARRDDLFLGVIAGWETQIGQDFDTGKVAGYRALTNAGFGAASPPAEVDAARVAIVREFIGSWARSLIDAGVPKGKVYSHIAYMSEASYKIARRVNPSAVPLAYLPTIHFTPPASAFADACIPGVSTYPQPGHLEQWRAELARRGNPPWASCEGTAIDPGEAEQGGRGMGMERYLGNLFNHGAVLVTVFGWGVGDKDNPFRKIAEGDASLAAYRKFLRGATLDEAPIPIPSVPPEGLAETIHKVQATLPGWIEKNGPRGVKDDLQRLEKSLKEKRFDDAAEAAAAILKTIEK